jgi:hypothetical protein
MMRAIYDRLWTVVWGGALGLALCWLREVLL